LDNQHVSPSSEVPSSIGTAKRLLRYVLAHKGRLTTAIIAGLLVAGCTSLVALMGKWFITLSTGGPVTKIELVEYGIDKGWWTVDHASFALLWVVCGMMPILYAARGLFDYINSYSVASVTNRVGADVRQEIYAHLQTLPLSFFHKSRIGDIISRMNNDVGLIQNSGQIVAEAIKAPSMIVVGLAAMFWLSWKLSLMTIVFVPIIAIAIDKLAKKMRALTTTTQSRLADVSSTIEESVRGIRIIRSFGTEDQEIKRFGVANTNSLRAALRAVRRSALVLPVIELLGAVSVAVVMLFGGYMMAAGTLELSTLMAFAIMALNVAAAAKQVARLNVTYQQTIAGAERVFELIDTKSDLIEDPDAVVLADIEGSVEFADVCFEYNPGEPVLDQLSFKIDPGEAVAIVGPSGAGKSTVADLIPRFYDVTSGKVMVEGHDVRHINTQSLRRHIAMVPQETILFSGTIADNIAYGCPGAEMDKIIEAAKSANAHDFIQELPAGYHTLLGEAGVGLSGGQRQRISIARALLKNPRILVLDEATSSLDAASEGIVQDALDKLMRGRSTLIIAHRLSTVTGADRILVMDRGRVVESGSFAQLSGGSGVFAQLYRTQFRTEEVAQTVDG